jgi:lysophospholipase L1-like esterase
MNSLKGTPYVTPEETLVDMVAIVDAARARNQQVLWFGILPFKGCAHCTEDTSPGVARAREYNALMAQACARRPEVTCVRLYSEFEDPAHPDFMKPEYTCDGIHFNQLGAQRLAEEVGARLPR